MSRQAIMLVSEELLEPMDFGMLLPCKILAISSPERGYVKYRLECETFVDTPAGSLLPDVEAVFGRGDDDKPVFLRWQGPAVEQTKRIQFREFL